MKRLFKVVLVAGCMLMLGSFAASAQNKIGYVAFNNIIDIMPEKAIIAKNLQDYQKQFMDVLQGMQAEYQTKGTDYEAKKATFTDAVRQQREGELTDIQKRIQDYSTQAQQKMEAKQNELAKPLFDKVKLAVTAVAKEKGYAYVFDSSQTTLLVAPDADDLLAAVKLKLGLK